MKAKKWLSLLLVVALTLSVAAFVSACTPKQNDANKVTVTWYDGRNVLKTDKVEKGSTLTEWTPEKDGYVFTGWYGESSLTNPFSFETKIETDTNIFSRWRSENVEEDTRYWYAIGSMTESNWKFATAKNDAEEWVIEEGYESLIFQKTDTKNVLELTLTLRPGVKFRFATNLYNSDWTGDGTGTDAQAGLGNLKGFEYAAGTNPEKNLEVTAESKEYGVVKGADGKVVFEGGYEFNMPTNQWNIWPVQGQDGVYKFTLTTYPGAEENNTVEWECIEKLEPLDETHDMYLVGTVTGDGETWSDDYETAIKLTRDSNDATLWKAYVTITDTMYPTWSATENPAGVPAAALKVKNNISGLDYGIGEQSGSAGSNNMFLTAGEYCITYCQTDNKVSFEKLAYYVVGTFVDNDENVNFTVKGGYSTQLTSEDGDTYTANVTITDVSAREGYGWMGEGNICALKVVYGSTLGIKDDGWYGVGETGGDNYFFTEEGDYVVTLVVSTKTLTVAKATAPVTKYTVTYYDGENVIQATPVEENTTINTWTPDKKEGFEFKGWFADAEFTTAFDFTQPITADTAVYAKYEEAVVEVILDLREDYFLCGNGTGDIKNSNWAYNTKTAFVRDAGTNIYRLNNFTLKQGDEMKLRFHKTLWNSGSTQYAFGEYFFQKNTDIFGTGSSNWDGNAKVVAGKSGIYNIILETKGANTSTTGRQEAQIVRFEFELVESLDVTVTDLGCYITGDFVTPNWAQTPGSIGAHLKMTQTADPDVYEITYNFAAGKSLKCIHFTSVGGSTNAEWALDYTGTNAAGGNYKTAQAGYHKITFNVKTRTFTVEYIGTELPEANA